MNVALLMQKGLKRLREIGPSAMLKETAGRLLIPSGPDAFDAHYGTDTAGSVSLWQYSGLPDSAKHGRAYQTLDPWLIAAALNHVPKNCTFVDLGCGKGRVLIIAKECGFEEVIGVEFIPDLAYRAEQNCKRANIQASVIAIDALDYNLPAGPLCLYLYNPFGIEIMKHIVEKVRARQAETWVVLMNPSGAGEENIAAWDGCCERVTTSPGRIIWARPSP